jgi:hypothetical protein
MIVANAASAASGPVAIRTSVCRGASPVGSHTRHEPSSAVSTTACRSIGVSRGRTRKPPAPVRRPQGTASPRRGRSPGRHPRPRAVCRRRRWSGRCTPACTRSRSGRVQRPADRIRAHRLELTAGRDAVAVHDRRITRPRGQIDPGSSSRGRDGGTGQLGFGLPHGQLPPRCWHGNRKVRHPHRPVGCSGAHGAPAADRRALTAECLGLVPRRRRSPGRTTGPCGALPGTVRPACDPRRVNALGRSPQVPVGRLPRGSPVFAPPGCVVVPTRDGGHEEEGW